MHRNTAILIALVCIFAGFIMLSPVRGMAADQGTNTEIDAVAEQHPEVTHDEHDKEEAAHGDPFARVFEVLAIILLCAVIGRYGAQKLKQSPVLGELLIGIIAGALIYQMGSPALTIIRHQDIVHNAIQKTLDEDIGWDEAVETTLSESGLSVNVTDRIRAALLSDHFPEYERLANSILLFSSLGVILLLFMVGLESNIHEMKEVGGSASSVALLGVIAPFILGYVSTILLFPGGTDPNVPIFIGATLCATSIGITARVFKDMNKLGLSEAKIVLGAAVLDDVLGLIVLAIVTGIVTSGTVEVSTIGLIFLKAIAFLGAVVFFGLKFLKKNVAFFARLDQSNVKLLYPFGLLMILAWLADLIGLATIVGAFAAGLIIEEEHFFADHESRREGHSVESIIAPIEGIFAPVFFVLMGMQVDVGTFADLNVLLIGLILTVVAIIGKVVAPLLIKKGNDKLIIGFGMIPRGEVGLIFASIGKSIGVLDNRLFSIIIIVVILTTLVTPPLLKWAIERREKF
jgi:Kef-type K+ transport system membrane component KefB